MNALLKQVQELLYEHYAILTYGTAKDCKCLSCKVYRVTIDDQKFEGDTFSQAIAEAWTYVCEKDSNNAQR